MPQGEIILYQSENGEAKIDVRLENETVWLTLDQMAELFGRDKSTISRHIKNIYIEGELNRESTVANFATVQNEGGRLVERNLDYYNLDVIISVGYRVKSLAGTHFRIWATQRIKDMRTFYFTYQKCQTLSGNMTAKNIEVIEKLFPNCVTETLDTEHSTESNKVYKKAVNFELLKQMLSPDVLDGDEAYEFTWVEKKIPSWRRTEPHARRCAPARRRA